MEFKSIFAGFGGQGIISMGTLTAYAGMIANKNTTFFPAYGIAMRGGAANCTVIVSKDEIASPIVSFPNTLIAMNEIALNIFEPKVEEGGTVLINSTLVERKANRSDIKAHYVDASGIATTNGDIRMANMVMIGGLLKVTNILSLDSVFEAMEKTFPTKIKHLIEKNREVMQKGYDSL